MLPALSGILLALSFPPVPAPGLAFVALIPLLFTLARLPAGPAGAWAATRAGLITGVVAHAILLYWIAVALLRYSPLAVPAYLGAVLVLATLTALFARGLHFVHQRLPISFPLLAAVLWTALEWVRAHLGPLSFPWLGLGASLAPVPRLAGAADLAGAHGLAFWIAGVNGLLAVALVRVRDRGHTTRWVAAAALAIAAPAVYGLVRAETLTLRPAARVAVIQPDIPEEVKLGPLGVDSSMAALTRLTRSLRHDSLDLIAWPEVALPVDLLRDDALRERVRRLSAEVGAPILVGAYGVDGDGDVVAYNSAFLADGAVAAAWPRYDKRRLVPFVERVPWIDPRPEPGPAGRYIGSLASGGERPLLRLEQGTRIGVLICYESIFGELSRDYRRAGADVLVNITNDAWYGREEWWGRTTALWQHPAHVVLRAIETRTGVARAANTGISMFIDPLGRARKATPLFEAAVAVDTVLTTDATPLFVRAGDWLGGTAAMAALALVLVAWLGPRRSEPAGRAVRG